MTEKKDDENFLGTLLPEENDGKCPRCKSANIKTITVCVICSEAARKCLDCNAWWQQKFIDAGALG